MENRSLSRQEMFKEIAMTFLNASRGHGMRVYDFDNPIERLSGLALMLYLMKNNSLVKAINMPDSKDAVVLTISPSLEAGDFENWISQKIGSKGLLKTAPINNAVVANLYERYRKSLRMCNDPYSLIKAFDLIRAANLAEFEYLMLLEVAEKYMASNSRCYEFTNPSSLGQLVWNVLSNNPESVFDPFMGTATFATTLPSDIKFTGWDLNQDIVEYTQIKLAISDRRFVCEVADSPEKACCEKYDAIVTFPPIGVQHPNGIDFVEYAFRLFKEQTTDSGEMAIVVANNFCSSRGIYANLRKEFTEKNYLDKIIAIPGGYLYGTSIPCTVLHLKKNREENESIKVYNFGEDVIELERGRIEIDPTIEHIANGYSVEDLRCVYIYTDDIRNQEYSWEVLRYPEKHKLGRYHGGDYIPFKDVVTRFRPESYNAAEFADKILHIRKVDFYLNKIGITDAKSGRYVIVTEPVLVVGYKASCPLIAIEASKSKPAYLSNREIIYRCSDKVLPKYLAHLFSNNYLDQRYFEMGYPIDINRHINTWLQGIDICIIPIAEQQVIVEDAYRAHLKKQAEDAHMSEFIEKIKEEYTQEVRSRKHNMRPFLREMKSSNDLAKLILQKTTSVDEIKEKLLPLLEKMERNRKGLSEIVDHLSQVDKYGEPELVEINRFMHERFLFYKNQTEAKISCHSSIASFGYCEETGKFLRLEKPQPGHFIMISPYDLRRMFDCIIDNARVHGFEGNDKGHRIDIDLSYDENEEMVEIRFTNDGKPLPKGFDINRYSLLGEKAGIHAGTGDGGHQVVSIAKHFHGYVTLESTSANDPEPRVSIIVHLPAYDKDEWDNEEQGQPDFTGDPIISISKEITEE